MRVSRELLRTVAAGIVLLCCLGLCVSVRTADCHRTAIKIMPLGDSITVEKVDVILNVGLCGT
jgi:hypothetical protein